MQSIESENNRWQDPQADREASRYERPVPSRERILEVLDKESHIQFDAAALVEYFGLKEPTDIEALRRRVNAMLRDTQIVNRRGILQSQDLTNLMQGKVRAHPDGFGFLLMEGSNEDWMLLNEEMQKVFDGDLVLARDAQFSRKGRRVATIHQVLQRNTATVVGRYETLAKVHYVIPDHPRILHEIMVSVPDLSVKPGQLVVVQITRQPDAGHRPMGKIIEVLGDNRAPGMEIDIAVRTYGVPFRFPVAVEQEVAPLPEVVTDAEKTDRVDIRDLPLVTIDGEDARDFDDAVWVQRHVDGGFRLLVAIADVGHYVRPDTALDQEALLRGTSVYFPDSVIPMLPESLSNGLCSLKPEVDRLCLVCDMGFSPMGQRTEYRFYWAVMHSQARLTYQQVQHFLEQRTHLDIDCLKTDQTAVGRSLVALQELYHVLFKLREQRGALDFEMPETRIVFNEDRKIETIVARSRLEAHRLIEEAMLAANVCAAEWAVKNDIPILFRNHQGPTAAKLQRLQKYLSLLGLSLTKTQDPTPEQIHALLEKVHSRPDSSVIENMILRSMAQAYYGSENIGHFGLHFAAYAHFTSPIRRYPDLLLHRALKAFSCKQTQLLTQIREHLQEWGEQSSMAERRADEATRDVVAWLKCEYMQDRVGQQFPGIITTVITFGFFVELNDLFVEGLVHVSRLDRDYYELDERRQSLVGEHTGREFRIGQSVSVQVVSVDMDQRRIDFALVSAKSTGKQQKKKS